MYARQHDNSYLAVLYVTIDASMYRRQHDNSYLAVLYVTIDALMYRRQHSYLAVLYVTKLQLRRFALAFIHSHSGATGVF